MTFLRRVEGCTRGDLISNDTHEELGICEINDKIAESKGNWKQLVRMNRERTPPMVHKYWP
jgi:hypothetical protein